MKPPTDDEAEGHHHPDSRWNIRTELVTLSNPWEDCSQHLLT